MKSTKGQEKTSEVSAILNAHLMEYADGIYNGQLRRDMRHGNGCFLWDDGSFYFGMASFPSFFKNGVLREITGEWKENRISGKGIFMQQNGEMTFGHFVEGVLNGPVVLQLPNSIWIQCFLRNGQIEGECIVFDEKAKSWKFSEYKKGKETKVIELGSGVPSSFKRFSVEKLPEFECLTTPHQSKEKSPIEYGRITFRDGGKYFGCLIDGVPNGLGLLMYPDRKYDVGMFRNGIINGFGIIKFKGGDFFNGFVKSGKMDGDGYYYSSSRKKWVFGRFSQNKLLKEYFSGKTKPFVEITRWNEENHPRSMHFVNAPTNIYLVNGRVPIRQGSHKAIGEKQDQKLKNQDFFRKGSVNELRRGNSANRAKTKQPQAQEASRGIGSFHSTSLYYVNPHPSVNEYEFKNPKKLNEFGVQAEKKERKAPTSRRDSGPPCISTAKCDLENSKERFFSSEKFAVHQTVDMENIYKKDNFSKEENKSPSKIQRYQETSPKAERNPKPKKEINLVLLETKNSRRIPHKNKELRDSDHHSKINNKKANERPPSSNEGGFPSPFLSSQTPGSPKSRSNGWKQEKLKVRKSENVTSPLNVIIQMPDELRRKKEEKVKQVADAFQKYGEILKAAIPEGRNPQKSMDDIHLNEKKTQKNSREKRLPSPQNRSPDSLKNTNGTNKPMKNGTSTFWDKSINKTLEEGLVNVWSSINNCSRGLVQSNVFEKKTPHWSSMQEASDEYMMAERHHERKKIGKEMKNKEKLGPEKKMKGKGVGIKIEQQNGRANGHKGGANGEKEEEIPGKSNILEVSLEKIRAKMALSPFEKVLEGEKANKAKGEDNKENIAKKKEKNQKNKQKEEETSSRFKEKLENNEIDLEKFEKSKGEREDNEELPNDDKSKERRNSKKGERAESPKNELKKASKMQNETQKHEAISQETNENSSKQNGKELETQPTLKNIKDDPFDQNESHCSIQETEKRMDPKNNNAKDNSESKELEESQSSFSYISLSKRLQDLGNINTLISKSEELAEQKLLSSLSFNEEKQEAPFGRQMACWAQPPSGVVRIQDFLEQKSIVSNQHLENIEVIREADEFSDESSKEKQEEEVPDGMETPTFDQCMELLNEMGSGIDPGIGMKQFCLPKWDVSELN